MRDTLLKNIPLTTIILSYFFICGGLYLVGFWTTFEFNVANLINVSDIPKSFVIPFALMNGFFIFNMITDVSLLTPELKRDIATTTKNSEKKGGWFLQMITDLHFIYIMVMCILIALWGRFPLLFWLGTSFVTGYYFSFRISRSSLFDSTVKAQMRFYIGCFMALFPCLSFGYGKLESFQIIRNREYRFVKSISFQNSTPVVLPKSIKLLGFVGTKMIVSSIDNSIIIVLNQEDIKAVELVKRSKQKSGANPNVTN